MNTESSYIYDTRKRCYVKSATSTLVAKKHNGTLVNMKRIAITAALLMFVVGGLLWSFPIVVDLLSGAEVNAATTAQSDVVIAGR